MRRITFTNSINESVTISTQEPFLLLNFETNVMNEMYSTKSPNQDGEAYRDSSLEVRETDIELLLTDKTREGLLKKKALINRVFNPKLGQGTLLYEDMGITRIIKGEVDVLPFFKDLNISNSRCLIPIISHNPFWLSLTESAKEIVSWIGGMRFPLILPTSFAIAGDKVINVRNEGEVETPIKIEIFGPASYPKINKRETGEYLKINKVLDTNDVVTITTEFGNKRVELNGENAFNLLDLPDSKFFNLDIGDNVLEFTTEDITNSANVKITYRNRYIGV